MRAHARVRILYYSQCSSCGNESADAGLYRVLRSIERHLRSVRILRSERRFAGVFKRVACDTTLPVVEICRGLLGMHTYTYTVWLVIVHWSTLNRSTKERRNFLFCASFFFSRLAADDRSKMVCYRRRSFFPSCGTIQCRSVYAQPARRTTTLYCNFCARQTPRASFPLLFCYSRLRSAKRHAR